MESVDNMLKYSQIRAAFLKELNKNNSQGPAFFTHYLHNRSNGTTRFYRKQAWDFVANLRTDLLLNGRNIFDSESRIRWDIPFPSPANEKFTFIDLFAGIGGFRLGLQGFGGKCVFSSEWDVYAQKTYEANFGEVPFGDINSFAGEKISDKQVDAFVPDHDILAAGFPCQAFSIAGKKGGFKDTRGTLFFNVAHIIKVKKPKAFILENVKGLKSHKGGATLETILNVLRNDLKYHVPDPEILNARDFGVPQNRERIFIVGFKDKISATDFVYPEGNGDECHFSSVMEEEEVSVKYYLSTRYLKSLREHKLRHARKGNGFGYEIIGKRDVANAVVVGGMGRERNLVVDKRLRNFKPITNITGSVNREGIRKMTPREWAGLQGFPKEFQFENIVSDAQAYKQFGNSVPVPVVKTICKKIVKEILQNVRK